MGKVMLNFLIDLPMKDRREETFDVPDEEVLQVKDV